MEQKQVEEIIESLPGGRTKFYYFKDRYALILLSFLARKMETVHEVKKSPYGRLLGKPLVRDILGKKSHSVLSSMEFESFLARSVSLLFADPG